MLGLGRVARDPITPQKVVEIVGVVARVSPEPV
jgi:hypothetical protein